VQLLVRVAAVNNPAGVEGVGATSEFAFSRIPPWLDGRRMTIVLLSMKKLMSFLSGTLTFLLSLLLPIFDLP